MVRDGGLLLARGLCYLASVVKSSLLADILELSVAERIQLAEDIWDSVAEVPESVSLTEAQRQELDRRLAEYERDPNGGLPWQVVI